MTLQQPLNACTIVSKNYLPYARVLAQSFLDRVPDGQFFVLLVDRNDGHIDPSAEPYTLVEAEDVTKVPDIASFLFKYTLLEANTAIKPYFLEQLFEEHGLESLIYFDPDILITGSLDELADLLGTHNVVLTPHLTTPIADNALPGELQILQAGTYNLGFVALRGGDTSRQLLRWWQGHLYEDCVVRIDRGLFVDQKWMDLVPGLYEGVHIHRHPGYNAAYWNLHGRTVTRVDTPEGPHDLGYRSNDEPLIFFHFSGIQPDHLEPVSKHQDRFRLGDIGAAADLYRLYGQKVFDAGYAECKPWPYAFGRFDNGVAIPNAARSLYLGASPALRRRFGNPFEAGGEQSFFRWLQEPAAGASKTSPYLTRLLAHIHGSRGDLTSSFPDVAGKDFPAFSSWIADYGRHELKLDPAFLGTLFRESRATLLTADGLKRRVKNRLKRLLHSPVGRSAKETVKNALGAERFRALKSKVRPTPPVADAAPSPIVSRRLPLPPTLEHPGINLVGYLQAETGMGEAARSLARALESAGIPTSLHSLDLNVLARQGDASFAPLESEFPHDINLFVLNADQVEPVYHHLGAEVFAGRFNVGFWLWELELFPDVYRPAFDVLHEVWTPSTFCLDAMSAIAPVPVRRVPLPVEVDPEIHFDRAHFDLDDGTFVFFYMFNFLSYIERKNPLAAVRAFRQAFGDDDRAMLLLKTSQGDFEPEAKAVIEAEIGDANVRLLDTYLDRSEINALTALTDAYVSPHRSEGYGLTLAEAMAHGKPVIATPYSGNTDFFGVHNGLPVAHRLVELTDDAGPYPKGARWADVDIDDLARQMRRLVDDPDLGRSLGARAREDIERELSHAAIGRLLERRYGEILRRVDGQSVGLIGID